MLPYAIACTDPGTNDRKVSAMSSHARVSTSGRPAFGLPNWYYTDPAVLDRELATLFRRSWQIVGREMALGAAGDYLTCTIGGEPLVVLRNKAMQLRALHNVCAHRGMRLAEGAGNCKRLTCPYHSWAYDLDGRLQAVPYAERMPTGFDKSDVHLAPAQVDTWGGFVFVNLDPEAESLRGSLGEMVERWEAYCSDWDALQEVKRLAFNEQCNWKIFMENATDYYHIPFIHQKSLRMPPVFENGASGQHFMLTTATPEENYSRLFDLIFPNSYFHVGPNKIQLFRVLPVSPETSNIEIVLYQTPAQMDTFPLSDPTKHRDVNQILDEDLAICRVLQQQASSKHFQVRYTAADYEDGVNHFDSTLLAALSDTSGHDDGPTM